MNKPASRPHWRSDHALRGIHRLSIRSARTAELCGMLNGLAHAQSQDLGLRWLATWIENHPEIHDCWPASDLRHLLKPLLQDPTQPVTPFLDHLRNIRTDANQQLTTWSTPASTRFDPPQPIVFRNRLFCFTGLFSGFANAANPRAEVERITTMRGGIVHPRVVRRLDYLIVGSTAHPAWTASCHGTKIAKAQQYKSRYNSPILILREVDWSRSIVATPPVIP